MGGSHGGNCRNVETTGYADEEPYFRWLRRLWLVECDRRRAADERTDMLIEAICSDSKLVTEIKLGPEPRKLLIQRHREARDARSERWIVD